MLQFVVIVTDARPELVLDRIPCKRPDNAIEDTYTHTRLNNINDSRVLICIFRAYHIRSNWFPLCMIYRISHLNIDSIWDTAQGERWFQFRTHVQSSGY